MDAKDIQKVLAEQREQAAISSLNEVKLNQILRGKELKDIRGESWIKNKKESMKELSKDPNWLANQPAGAKKRRESYYDNEIKKKEAAAKRESNLEFKEERAKRNKTQVNDPKYQQNLKSGVEKRDSNPEYKISLLKAAEKKLIARGFLVSPNGVHLRQKDSAEANNISVATLQRKISTNPTEYYYITQEEYIMLTGKEI